MTFDRWYFLLGLLLLPYVWYFQIYIKKTFKLKYSNVETILESAKKEKFFSLKKVLAIINVLILGLLIISAAGPKKGLVSKEEMKKVIDIMLCLDTSTSMSALDFNPKNRFEVAREAAKEFVKLRKNDRIGVVVFSGVPILMCPLTVDKDTVLRVLDNTNIGIVKLDGTAIGSAIMQCIARMKDIESKTKIIILLTDGRNNLGEIDPITAAKAAQSLDIKIYTIGCGTAGGKSLYIVDDPFWGKRQVYLDQDLDEPTLIQIAEITGGKYFNVRTREKMFEVFKEIDKMEKTEIKISEYKEYRYFYQIPLFLSFLLFGLRVVLEKVLYLKIP
ncbi:MAG: VWA domain-containing protein [Endomicrobiia bacterium]